MTSCRRRLVEAGLVAPRTCTKCGLSGVCSEPPTLEEVRARLRHATSTEQVKMLTALMMQAASIWEMRSGNPTGHRSYPDECRRFGETLQMTATVMIALAAERDALSDAQDLVAKRMRSDVVLPTREECVDAVVDEKASALQQFIFDNEPSLLPREREIFRRQLAAALREVRS